MADVYFRPDGQNRFQIRSAANGTLPSAWLDQEFNRIYTYLNTIESGGSSTGSEWSTVNAEGTQVSSTSFTLVGDYSGVFEEYRAIRLTDDSDVRYFSHIKSSTFVEGTNTTTVVLYDAIVPQTIKTIDIGLIGKDASSIQSYSYKTVSSSPYVVTSTDQIIFANDNTIGSLTQVWDDEQVNGDGYYALLINLPVAGDFPGKLLCIKKIDGSYQTIVSSVFTHTTTTDGTNVTHHNTYGFQIYGDTNAKNRITLKGIGDCYWVFSNGQRWYELTPEASETVKGIVRMATEEEMTLTAQQIADGDSLKRNLAVSPYQLDKAYLRNDASNMYFSSNFIYKTPSISGIGYGTAAYLSAGNIVVPSGVGISIADGRDENGVGQNFKVELSQDYTTSQVEVSSKKKTLFILYDKSTQTISLKPFFSKNVYYGYYFKNALYPYFSSEVAWFDYKNNVWRYSSDNGTNWTYMYGVPVCKFWGNGSAVTNVQTFSPVEFATRDDINLVTFDYIVDQYIDNGSSGFRLWKSGILENWGVAASGNVFCSFLRPFHSAEYNIVGGIANVANAGGTHWFANRTNTGFYLIAGFGDRGNNGYRGSMWYHAIGVQSVS